MTKSRSDEMGAAPAEMLSGSNLTKEARFRKRETEHQSIPKGTSIPRGWGVHREYKTTIRLVREKSVNTLLEDKIWLLFYGMGIPLISNSEFSVQIKSGEEKKKFKPTVVAQDEEIVFVVVTEAQELPARKKRLQNVIEDLIGDRNRIRNAIKKQLGVTKAKFVFILATENIIWHASDEELADENQILKWDEYDILALHELAELAGEGARYQIYNRIFYGTKIRAFEQRIPALRAKMGGKSYYCMAMTPEHLLKIAYVHQRSGSSALIDISNTYQRVLNHRRVQNIRKYIEEGGYFPNSIILNFTKQFQKIERIGTKQQLNGIAFAEPVLVTLPPYYGSAWIIDGQHRVYGYAESALKNKETIPVVAFVDDSVEDQAKMFLDINQNQKAIKSDLRWDLYEDLYLETKSRREDLLYSVSLIAKRLNELSPINGSVSIPSVGTDGHISLTTLCRVIHGLKFIDDENGPFFRGTFRKSIEPAAKRIAQYFQIIFDNMGREWRAATAHYVNTNAGFVVLLGLLRDFLHCFKEDEIGDEQKYEKKIEEFLAPVINYLKKASAQTIENLRKAGGATGVSRQIQAILTQLVLDADVGFESEFIIEYEKQREREREKALSLDGGEIILLAGESETKEIKGSTFLDINRLILGDQSKERSEETIREILLTIVGFLNSNKGGGRLTIGAIETERYSQDKIEAVIGSCPQIGDYSVVGVERDYGYKNWDWYELKLRDLINERISKEAGALITINALLIQGHTLAIVEIKRDLGNWHYLDGDQFYVRTGNQTLVLKGREMDNYKETWIGKTV